MESIATSGDSNSMRRSAPCIRPFRGRVIGTSWWIWAGGPERSAHPPACSAGHRYERGLTAGGTTDQFGPDHARSRRAQADSSRESSPMTHRVISWSWTGKNPLTSTG